MARVVNSTPGLSSESDSAGSDSDSHFDLCFGFDSDSCFGSGFDSDSCFDFGFDFGFWLSYIMWHMYFASVGKYSSFN